MKHINCFGLCDALEISKVEFEDLIAGLTITLSKDELKDLRIVKTSLCFKLGRFEFQIVDDRGRNLRTEDASFYSVEGETAGTICCDICNQVALFSGFVTVCHYFAKGDGISISFRNVMEVYGYIAAAYHS